MKDVPLREDIPRLYLEENLSCRQIAERVGLTRGAVYSVLKHRGVELRPPNIAFRQRYPNGRTGPLAANWRGGKSKCVDCGEEVVRLDATRCKGCELRNRNGEKNTNWRGGTTRINQRMRSTRRYKDWRKSVFERDDYTCQNCGQRGGDLQADHIKPFAYHPELRFDIDNGRTLCLTCHYETDTFGAGPKPRVTA